MLLVPPEKPPKNLNYAQEYSQYFIITVNGVQFKIFNKNILIKNKIKILKKTNEVKWQTDKPQINGHSGCR